MADGQVLQQILFFALLVLGFYLLAIRPQRQRARALAEVQAAVRPGSRVMTTAGIHATVASVEDDGTLLLEVAPGVSVRFVRQAVVQLLDSGAPEDGTA